MLLKNSILIVIVTIFLLINYSKSEACMSFRIYAKDGTQLVTRTMEFAYDLDYHLAIVPRGMELSSPSPRDSFGLKWRTKYAFVSITNFGITEGSADGMNEAGLTASALYYEPDTKYPEIIVRDYSQALAHAEIPAWILSNFSTVAEVRKDLSKAKIFGLSVPQFGGIPPLHFIVTDKFGECIVIEFDNGEIHINNNPFGVMTNSPNFSWHLTNVRQYLGLNPYRLEDKTIGGSKLIPTGEGTGMWGLPGDFSPPSRFVRAVFFTNNYDPPQDKFECLNLAQHIVNNFSIFKGMIIKKDNKGNPSNRESTQWTVFKDLTNGIFYFKTYDNLDLRSVDLNKIDKNAKKIKTIDMFSRKQMIYDVTNEAK